jgi:dihydrofolate reductase
MRKLKYYVACSVNGFISREDGSYDFFPMEGEHVADYIESLKAFDVVLMGRRTYEQGLKVGVTDPYPSMKSYVFSRTMKESPNERVALVSGDAGAAVRELKNGAGKDIYLCGGAALATTLFAEGLVDEVILKLNPLLIGPGIPLFSGPVRKTDLELTDTKIYGNGVLLLHYRVKR